MLIRIVSERSTTLGMYLQNYYLFPPPSKKELMTKAMEFFDSAGYLIDPNEDEVEEYVRVCSDSDEPAFLAMAEADILDADSFLAGLAEAFDGDVLYAQVFDSDLLILTYFRKSNGSIVELVAGDSEEEDGFVRTGNIESLVPLLVNPEDSTRLIHVWQADFLEYIFAERLLAAML
ncbi:MAG: hypothetical protein FWD45_05835, partial [Coriobacteriia bacterium]|nr:hypothetical protein [Coriobacteriia bacterium]